MQQRTLMICISWCARWIHEFSVIVRSCGQFVGWESGARIVQFISFYWLFGIVFAHADESLLKRHDVQNFMHKMEAQHHFNHQQLVGILKEAQFQPDIIESMNKPFEKKTWDVYKALFLTPERLQAGIQFWLDNQAALARAQQEYHVPADLIVAIIGVETLYGKHQGEYRVLDALTTLAFYYPKRSAFFTKELAEFLLLCREHGVSATQYSGSYAGAMGKPQFMPSSYRFYAVNYSEKGWPDLMNNDQDAIGSVANYFHQHGWKYAHDVVQPVYVRGSRYKTVATNTKSPGYAYQHLVAAGVKPITPVHNKPQRAGIIELTTPKGPEYWMAYPNFYVITRYNTSPQYAMVVYLFAQQLRKKWAILHQKQRSVHPSESRGLEESRVHTHQG